MRVGLTPCRHPKPRGSPERPLRLLRAKATPSSVFSITSGTTGSPWVGTPASVCLPRDFVLSCPSGVKDKSPGFQKLLHPGSQQLPGLRNPPSCLLDPHFNYAEIMLNPCINIAAAPSEGSTTPGWATARARLESKRRQTHAGRMDVVFKIKRQG